MVRNQRFDGLVLLIRTSCCIPLATWFYGVACAGWQRWAGGGARWGGNADNEGLLSTLRLQTVPIWGRLAGWWWHAVPSLSEMKEVGDVS